MEEQIYKDLHVQFAQNQNDHDSRFITFFVAILVLFAAYGTIYAMFGGWIKNEFDVKSEAICALSIVIGVVLTYFSCITLVAAKTFRRDQMLNDRIRYSSISKEKYDYIFIGYSGDNKKCEFIPDYLRIRFYFLLTLLIGVTVSLIFLIFSDSKNISGQVISLILNFILLSSIILFWCKTYEKYKSLAGESNDQKTNFNSERNNRIENYTIKQEFSSDPKGEHENEMQIEQTISEKDNSNPCNTTIKQSISLNIKK